MKTTGDIEYAFAERQDLPAIRTLLERCALMTDGIEAVAANCLVAKVGARLAGVVALEQCGDRGLLRSLAVAPEFRRRGLGRELCQRLLVHARSFIEELYLLTTEAEKYFVRQGFQRIEREEVPREIQTTDQFRSLCPESAVCMVRRLA